MALGKKRSLQDICDEDELIQQPQTGRTKKVRSIPANTARADRNKQVRSTSTSPVGVENHGTGDQVEKKKQSASRVGAENHGTGDQVEKKKQLRIKLKEKQGLRTKQNNKEQLRTNIMNRLNKNKNNSDQVPNVNGVDSEHGEFEQEATEINCDANEENVSSKKTTEGKKRSYAGRKKRSYTYMLHIWGRPAHLPLLETEFNDEGIPVGKSGHTLAEFMGTIARHNQYCPIDIDDWRKMPRQNKNDMMDIIKARFDISLADESYLLKSIGTKWKGWKCALKADYWEPGLQEYNIPADEPRVSRDQWLNIILYWNKEETKERCQKNKVARSKKKMDQATGKSSFASVSMKKEKETGRKQSRAELFKVCYTRKGKGKETPADVIKAINDMEELKSKLGEEEEDAIGPDDIFAQVCGQDKPGYVRMVGSNISASDAWGDLPRRTSTKRMMIEQKRKLVESQNEVAKLRAQLSTQQNDSTISPMPNQTLEIEVGEFVSLTSLVDRNKIVATGYIESKDPTKIVGTKALGKGWCEIMIMNAIHPEEDLLRTYDGYETVQEVIGTVIAWPLNLITRAQHE